MEKEDGHDHPGRRPLLTLMLIALPAIYFVGAYIFARKLPADHTGAVEMAPYAVVVLFIGVLVRSGRAWTSARGLLSLPFVVLGGGSLAAIAVSTFFVFY